MLTFTGHDLGCATSSSSSTTMYSEGSSGGHKIHPAQRVCLHLGSGHVTKKSNVRRGTALLRPARHPIRSASARPPQGLPPASPLRVGRRRITLEEECKVARVHCMRHRMNMGMRGFPIIDRPIVALVKDRREGYCWRVLAQNGDSLH